MTEIKQQVSKECSKCTDFLMSALETVNSRPKALLDALGVRLEERLIINNRHFGKTHVRANEDDESVSRESGKIIEILLPKIHQKNRNTRPVTSSAFGGRNDSTESIKNYTSSENSSTKYFKRERKERNSTSDHNYSSSTHSSLNENTYQQSPSQLSEIQIPNKHKDNNDNNRESVLRKIRSHLSLVTTNNNNMMDEDMNQKSSSTTILPNHAKAVATSANIHQIQPSHSQNKDNLTHNNQSYTTLSIQCQKCGSTGPEGGARAFVRGPDPLSIILCSNRLSSSQEIEQVLVHELIHVYDVHARNWDLTDCSTLARSEVRAAREAECAEGATMKMGFAKRYCVRDKAIIATKNMFPNTGNQCVANVFEEAMMDTAPFQQRSSDIVYGSHLHKTPFTDNNKQTPTSSSSSPPTFRNDNALPTSARSPYIPKT